MHRHGTSIGIGYDTGTTLYEDMAFVKRLRYEYGGI